jgi:hypothetical protein
MMREPRPYETRPTDNRRYVEKSQKIVIITSIPDAIAQNKKNFVVKYVCRRVFYSSCSDENIRDVNDFFFGKQGDPMSL